MGARQTGAARVDQRAGGLDLGPERALAVGGAARLLGRGREGLERVVVALLLGEAAAARGGEHEACVLLARRLHEQLLGALHLSEAEVGLDAQRARAPVAGVGARGPLGGVERAREAVREVAELRQRV